jgi:DNA polymerase III alpha subunit
MNLDHLSIPVYSSDDIIEIIYQDKIDLLKEIFVDPNDQDIIKFNLISRNLEESSLNEYKTPDIKKEDFDQSLYSDWLMPEEYKNMDIEGYLVNVCPKQNYQRLIEELVEFRERNMINLLRWLKYFVDTCKKNKVVWGVGRGSSVSSYVLYLIGIHKIDSIKYKLDWRDFLR